MKKRLQTNLITIACMALVCMTVAASATVSAKGKVHKKVSPVAHLVAATTPQVLAVSGLELSLQGDSTLHKWEAKAAQVSLTADLKPGVGSLLQRLKAGELTNLTLNVKVNSLHSPEGSSMDKNMHKCMHEVEHPEIYLVLSHYKIDGEKLKMEGNLDIAGVTKTVELGATIVEADGKVLVAGAYEMLMSSFGIPPPVMMLGAIKTKDNVTVSYKFALALPFK